jgi:enoyl-CoA hydratase
VGDIVIGYDLHGSVAVITIDRPPVNAYDAALERDLAAAWRRAADDPAAAVVVLRAEGPHFCAGVDVAPDAGPGAPATERLGAGEELRFVRDLPKPTIVAVQGGCVGGGQRFVFPCDLIFCSDDAFFRDPLAALGMGGVLAPMATWLYGPRLAKEMLFSGMRVPATRMHEIGAVNRLLPRDELWPATLAFATELAALDRWSLRQAKRAVNATMDLMGQQNVATRLTEQLDHVRGAGH